MGVCAKLGRSGVFVGVGVIVGVDVGMGVGDEVGSGKVVWVAPGEGVFVGWF